MSAGHTFEPLIAHYTTRVGQDQKPVILNVAIKNAGPSGIFALRLDGLSYDTDAIPDREVPEDGKKYAVATITVKSLIPQSQTLNDFTAGDPTPCAITDSGGETDNDAALLKAKSNEVPERDFQQGEEYTFRVVFPLAKDATAKILTPAGGRFADVDVPRHRRARRTRLIDHPTSVPNTAPQST